MSSLHYLGIHEGDISSVVDLCESMLKTFEISNNGWDENYTEILKECGDWEDITSSIQRAYMETTLAFIQDKYPDLEIDYEINGCCNSVTINGEEYNEGDEKGKFIKDFSLTTDMDIVELSYDDIQDLNTYFCNDFNNKTSFNNRHDFIIEVSVNWESFCEEAEKAVCEADLDDAYDAFMADEEEGRGEVFKVIDQNNGDKTIIITLQDIMKDVTDLDDPNSISQMAKNFDKAVDEKMRGIANDENTSHDEPDV